jgi:hypothetical protein
MFVLRGKARHRAPWQLYVVLFEDLKGSLVRSLAEEIRYAFAYERRGQLREIQASSPHGSILDVVRIFLEFHSQFSFSTHF